MQVAMMSGQSPSSTLNGNASTPDPPWVLLFCPFPFSLSSPPCHIFCLLPLCLSHYFDEASRLWKHVVFSFSQCFVKFHVSTWNSTRIGFPLRTVIDCELQWKLGNEVLLWLVNAMEKLGRGKLLLRGTIGKSSARGEFNHSLKCSVLSTVLLKKSVIY